MVPPYWERLPPSRVRAPEALRPAGSSPTPSERLAFDSQTQTVILDGTQHKVDDPKAFAVYREIAGACPQPVTAADIRGRVKGCRGTKKVRQLLNTLPDPLRRTVRSGQADYWLDLRPAPRGRKGRT
jgi:hypothetical protein